jgi:hypothetical protein
MSRRLPIRHCSAPPPTIFLSSPQVDEPENGTHFLLCKLRVSPQAFYNETANDLARFLTHICTPTNVIFKVRVTRTPEADYLGTSQVQAVVLKMKACFTTLARGGKSVDTWSPVRAFNPFLEDSELVAFLEMAGLTVTDEGLKEEKRRKEERQGQRAEAERKMLTHVLGSPSVVRKSAEKQVGGKTTDGDDSPGLQKKRPGVQLSVETKESAGKKARNKDGTAGIRNRSNDVRPVYRPTSLSGQANVTTVGGRGNEDTAKESADGNGNAGSEILNLASVKLEPQAKDCEVVEHSNPWYYASFTRRVEEGNAKMAAEVQTA